MVESAQKRQLESAAGLLHSLDLGSEIVEPCSADCLPLVDVCGVEDPSDVVETQPGFLEHADEHQSAQRVVSVAALSRDTLVRIEQALPLVEADGRGGHVGPVSDLADGHQVWHIEVWHIDS